MKPEEIKKALEEHYKKVEKGYSDHLAYGGKGDEHEEKYIDMLSATLDLINQYEAEIEQYKDYNEKLFEKNEQIKAEAIKEFAERLKDDWVSNDPVVIATKCLLKEMGVE